MRWGVCILVSRVTYLSSVVSMFFYRKMWGIGRLTPLFGRFTPFGVENSKKKITFASAKGSNRICNMTPGLGQKIKY